MNEITLEKIDLVRERTGTSYEEAKALLERHDGNVVEAIVEFEKTHMSKETYDVPGNHVLEKVKSLISEGNVTRISVKQGNDILINIPVNAGIVAAILAPVALALGAFAALATKCTIEVERSTDAKTQKPTETEKSE